MTIRIGDIFSSEAETLVNTVNCVGVMGKGIALEFKKRYPDMFSDYVSRCESGQVKPGAPYFFSAADGKSILLFPTKNHWRSPSKLSYIVDGLDWFLENYKRNNISSIAFPPLGCGNGGLPWSAVGRIMYSKLSALPIQVEIYAPFGTPAEQLTDEFLSRKLNPAGENAIGKSGIRFNKYWLLILYVVQALNRSRYSLSVGRTIFQKVCYILTRTGIPTGFVFTEGSYGAYSADVKPAITALSNANYMTERQLGQMMETVVSPSFMLDKAMFTPDEIKRADDTIDLMARIKSTDQAEMIGTVLFAYDEIIGERGAATEKEVFDRIHEWKKWWGNSKDEVIISSIRDLSILGWMKPDRSSGILVMEEELA